MTNQLTTQTAPAPYIAEIDRDPRLASTHTRRAYRNALGKFEAWRKGRPLTKTLVQEYVATLQRLDKAPKTINAALASIRWWARRVSDLAYDYGSDEQARKISDLAARVATVQGVTGSRVPTGRHLDNKEIIALLKACQADKTPAGARDAAIIAIIAATGIRASELLDVQLADITYTEDGADLIIRKGKGNKTRIAYLFGGSLKALNIWINHRGIESGHIFNAVTKTGKIQIDHPISYEALRKILVKRFNAAGLTKDLNWHDFRRTFIGEILDSGADLATAQSLAGHVDPKTTSHYDRRPDRRRREAVRLLSVSIPYPEEESSK